MKWWLSRELEVAMVVSGWKGRRVKAERSEGQVTMAWGEGLGADKWGEWEGELKANG